LSPADRVAPDKPGHHPGLRRLSRGALVVSAVTDNQISNGGAAFARIVLEFLLKRVEPVVGKVSPGVAPTE